MKVIIAGSRTIRDYRTVVDAIEESGFKVTEVVSGGAKGVDALGEAYADHNGIRIVLFEADWEKYGLAAGPKRNLAMAKYADALVAVWDGKSKGTENMIARAYQQGLHVYVKRVHE